MGNCKEYYIFFPFSDSKEAFKYLSLEDLQVAFELLLLFHVTFWCVSSFFKHLQNYIRLWKYSFFDEENNH